MTTFYFFFSFYLSKGHRVRYFEVSLAIVCAGIIGLVWIRLTTTNLITIALVTFPSHPAVIYRIYRNTSVSRYRESDGDFNCAREMCDMHRGVDGDDEGSRSRRYFSYSIGRRRSVLDRRIWGRCASENSSDIYSSLELAHELSVMD